MCHEQTLDAMQPFSLNPELSSKEVSSRLMLVRAEAKAPGRSSSLAALASALKTSASYIEHPLPTYHILEYNLDLGRKFGSS